jgi:hypothetical protein
MGTRQDTRVGIGEVLKQHRLEFNNFIAGLAETLYADAVCYDRATASLTRTDRRRFLSFIARLCGTERPGIDRLGNVE